MAGIGFALERMADGRTIGGAGGSYSYAAFLVAGPWIMMAVSIAAVSLNVCPTSECAVVEDFRSVLIYNFLFSLLLSGPICLPVTRFVSDEIFARRSEYIVGAYAASLMIYAVLGLAIAGSFYWFATSLSLPVKLLAFQNFILVGAAWLIAPFLGAIKSYRTISMAFVIGAATIIGIVSAAPVRDVLALLTIFNIGLAVLNAVLVACLFRSYGPKIRISPHLVRAAARYWDLALMGFASALGGWVDKLLVWFLGPNDLRLTVAGGLRTFPAYDAAMFWAQLTAIPLMVAFFVHVETGFFRRHQGFYVALGKQGSKRDLDERMSVLADFAIQSVVKLCAGACLIAIVCVLLEYVFFEQLGVSARQLRILRAGLFGSACYSCLLIVLVFLLYFDLRKQALGVTCFFLLTNFGFTAWLMPLGFDFFGYGYLFASGLSLLLGFFVLTRELPWLSYHACVTNNLALERDKSEGKTTARPRPEAPVGAGRIGASRASP